MDSFELNKIAGAVLGTLLLVLGLGILSSLIFNPTTPLVPGYDLPGAEESNGSSTVASIVEVVPISVRLANADPARGAKAVAKCKACHNFEEGAGAKVGPDLYNIVNRTVGTVAGFGYSAPMKERETAGDKWTYESLDAFIHNPKGFIKGTIMAFAGVNKADERADIIAYLRTLAQDPVPLPVPEEKSAEEEKSLEDSSSEKVVPAEKVIPAE